MDTRSTRRWISQSLAEDLGAFVGCNTELGQHRIARREIACGGTSIAVLQRGGDLELVCRLRPCVDAQGPVGAALGSIGPAGTEVQLAGTRCRPHEPCAELAAHDLSPVLVGHVAETGPTPHRQGFLQQLEGLTVQPSLIGVVGAADEFVELLRVDCARTAAGASVNVGPS